MPHRYVQAIPCLALIALTSGYSQDAISQDKFSISPGITVGGVYSENIAPNDPDLNESDFVADITPRLRAAVNSRRAQGKLDWSMNNYIYTANEERSTIHTFLARLNLNLVPEHFFIDFNSTQTQRIINAGGTRFNNNYTLTDNRTDQTTIRINPYWYQRLGNAAEMIFDTEYSKALFEDDKVSSNISDSSLASGTLHLRNRSTDQNLQWAFQARQQTIRYDNQLTDDLEFSQAGLQLGYQLLARFTPQILFGYEKNDFGNREVSDDPEDAFWAAGFQWQPNKRSQLEILAGKRYFGDTYKINWQQRGKYISTDLSYREAPEGEIYTSLRSTTYQNNAFHYSHGNLDLTDNIYINRVIRASLTYDKSKTSMTIAPFFEERSFTDSIDDQEIYGLDADFTWSITPRLDFQVNAYWDNIKYQEDASEQEYLSISASLDKQLGQQSSASITYDYSDSDNDNNALSYSENTISLSFTHWFGKLQTIDNLSANERKRNFDRDFLL